MTSTAEGSRTCAPGHRLAGLVLVAATVGIGFAALPSLRLLLDPPDPWFCPAIWPVATSCAPGPHLMVTVTAWGFLLSTWVVAHVLLRRVDGTPPRSAVVVSLMAVAVATWALARRPQPIVVAWSTLVG